MKVYSFILSLGVVVLSESILFTFGSTAGDYTEIDKAALEKQIEANEKGNVCIELEAENVCEEKYSEEEKYMLAKIVMAEAEGCDIETKQLVVKTVLCRVESDKFPDTVEEVIFQKGQFTPVSNGRYNRVEPNNDCYEAVETVINDFDMYDEVLFFESSKGSTWHSRNLDMVYEMPEMRFYR